MAAHSSARRVQTGVRPPTNTNNRLDTAWPPLVPPHVAPWCSTRPHSGARMVTTSNSADIQQPRALGSQRQRDGRFDATAYPAIPNMAVTEQVQPQDVGDFDAIRIDMAQSQLLVRLEDGSHDHQASVSPAASNSSRNFGPWARPNHANQVPGRSRSSLLGSLAGPPLPSPVANDNPWAATANKPDLSEQIARLDARIQTLQNNINNMGSRTSRLRAASSNPHTSRLRINSPCLICLDIPSGFPALRPTARCTHASTICAPCLEKHISYAVLDQGSTSLTCPDPGCRQAMEYADVLRSVKNKTCLDRYEQLLLRRMLEKEPNFVWCKNPACGWGQLHESGAAAPIVICQVCRARSCFIHDTPWHTGLTCEQYNAQMRNRERDHASRTYIEQHTKRCPNASCGRPIEKAEGCDHMTCRRPAGCGHQFCWICLADYAPIRDDGNHRHRSDCKYYAPIAPGARPRTYGTIERPQGQQRTRPPVTRPNNERTPLITTRPPVPRPAIRPVRPPPTPVIRPVRPTPGPVMPPVRPAPRPAIQWARPAPRPAIQWARPAPRPFVRPARPVPRPQNPPFGVGRRRNWPQIYIGAIKIAFCYWLFLVVYSLIDWLSE